MDSRREKGKGVIKSVWGGGGRVEGSAALLATGNSRPRVVCERKTTAPAKYIKSKIVEME